MHYFLADLYAIPPFSVGALSEAAVILPHTFQVNSYRSHPIFAKPVPPDESEAFVRKMRADSEVPDGGVVLCSMAGIAAKISPEVFAVWLQSIRRLRREAATLWLSGVGIGPLQDNLLQESLAGGVTSRELLFSEKADVEEYMKRSQLADVFVDTPITNSIASGSDHLWAGVPLATMSGRRMASRGAGSIVTALGLGGTGLIVETHKEYEDALYAFAAAGA